MTHHGSVGCKSTPLTLSERCENRRCAGRNDCRCWRYVSEVTILPDILPMADRIILLEQSGSSGLLDIGCPSQACSMIECSSFRSPYLKAVRRDCERPTFISRRRGCTKQTIVRIASRQSFALFGNPESPCSLPFSTFDLYKTSGIRGHSAGGEMLQSCMHASTGAIGITRDLKPIQSSSCCFCLACKVRVGMPALGFLGFPDFLLVGVVSDLRRLLDTCNSIQAGIWLL